MVQVFRAVPWVPVIVISTLGDLQGAKEAFKSGAVDFLTKPIDQELLVAAIAKAYEFEVRLDYLPGRQLTPAEKRVLLLLLSGNSNKEIAHVLSRSVRTVEVHRRRVMRKFGAANIVDVVKGAIRHGLIDV